ncbi:MAG: helix-turn-helix transcriptional regulator [Ruminococcaceae bacterium]|nr:helix-turn-helix transcriptional regulator [Oscillospiraceae bacterium]
MKVIYFSRTKIRNVRPLSDQTLYYTDITVVLNGVMRYSINHEDVELHAGDVIVFQKGDVRSRQEGGAAEYYSFNIITDEDDVLPIFSGVLRNQVNEEIKTLLSLYETYTTSYSGYAEEKSKYCVRILYHTLYEMSMTSRDNSYIIQLKRYIDEHIHESLTVSQVNKSVFLSPNYCNSLFKTHTGQNLNEYIRKTKMSKAQHLIIHTNIPLKEIASALGYKQYSYFSRVFTKEFHTSPAEYRKCITVVQKK